MSTLSEQLQEKATQHREYLKERQHASYHHARSLGFTSYDAQVLAGWPIEKINAVAAERGMIKP